MIVCIFEHVQGRWALNDSLAPGLRHLAVELGLGLHARHLHALVTPPPRVRLRHAAARALAALKVRWAWLIG
jgi:hypothetical protein